MESISILVVTKNRSVLLKKCLQSLEAQKQKPWEVVVIDNGSADDTKKIVDSYLCTLNLRYYYTKVFGYPKVYNYGLLRCRGKWVIFFDDDCIAVPSWFSAILRVIHKHPGAVIQGRTESIPSGNIYAQIMGDHYKNWLRANMVGTKRLLTFDNKNLCVPRWVIERYGTFNETLIHGSEDIELGIRYARHGVSIMYEPSIIAYHHEQDTLAGFISQHIRIARSEALLDRRLKKHDRIGVSSVQKIILYLRSLIKREIMYVRHGQILNLLKLPFLYFLLAVIRIRTYYMTVWGIQK